MNITKKQRQVLKAIQTNPEAANDDALLLAEVWAMELTDKGFDMTAERLHNMLKRVSRPETITRRRRELFNAGYIDYDKSASNRRMTAFRSELDVHSPRRFS